MPGSLEGLIFHSLIWGVGRKKNDDYFLQKAQSNTPNGSSDSPGKLCLGSLLGQPNFPNVQVKSCFCGRFRTGALKAGVSSHSSETVCACLLKQPADHTCPENKVYGRKGPFRKQVATQMEHGAETKVCTGLGKVEEPQGGSIKKQ